MKKYFAPLLACVLGSASLSAQTPLTSDSLLVDGNYRSFHFRAPASSRPGASVVFVMHGSGGSGEGMARSTARLEEEARKDNAIVVYPNGYKRFWNECRKHANSLANTEDVDDIAFFDAMIGYFKEHYAINEKHVFAVGTSGGGHMAYKLALLSPGKFRAVTAIIANLPTEENMDCGAANLPIAVMIVNGTEDTVNPYGGGEVRAGSFSPGTVRSTDETLLYFAALAGHRGAPVKKAVPDTNPDDGKTIERYTYKKRNKPEVVLLKVIGGKHDYPGDIDVHVEAWEFFKRQMK